MSFALNQSIPVVPHLGDDEALIPQNPYLEEYDPSVMYHFKLDQSMPLEQMFGDTKLVCVHGSAVRAQAFAKDVSQRFDLPLEWYVPKPALESAGVLDYAAFAYHRMMNAMRVPQAIGGRERFSLFKAGPVVSVNHGMGEGSTEIWFQEMALLMAYAKAKGVRIVRIGTSGGYGLEPGSVVIGDQAYDSQLRPACRIDVAGDEEFWDSSLDMDFAQELLACATHVRAEIGHIMGKSNLFMAEGRTDGVIAVNKRRAAAFHRRAADAGIKSADMEATMLAALSNVTGIPLAIVNATLDDCLDPRQLDFTKAQLGQFSGNAQGVVLNLIEKKLPQWCPEREMALAS